MSRETKQTIKNINIGGAARYFVMLRKNGFNRSMAIDTLRLKYRDRNQMFFTSQVSWFKLFLPQSEWLYLK